jgi:hypothetical protein
MNNFGRDFAAIVSGAKCRIKWCSLLCLSCHCVMALPPYGTSSKQQQLFSICNGILLSLPNKPTTVEHNSQEQVVVHIHNLTFKM